MSGDIPACERYLTPDEVYVDTRKVKLKVIKSVHEMQELSRQFRSKAMPIGFVPTMGNLHNGHLHMVKLARNWCSIVVVSIFVNPLQFGDPEDLKNYPRTFKEDCEKLRKENVDFVFAPEPDEMYPSGLDSQTFVEVPVLSDILEGASRPGHFRGVATVLNKLFNIVQPFYAFFGEKDFQQVAVVQKMVKDLAMDIKIVPVKTVRDENGLALSSRNGLLSIEDREKAPEIYKVMNEMAERLLNGERDLELIVSRAKDNLSAAGFVPDELFIQDSDTLTPVREDSKNAVILVAAYLGKVRLIDNMCVDLTEISTLDILPPGLL